MTELEDLNLSAAEQTAFEEFHNRCSKDIPPDIPDVNDCIYRFLKARDFNVDRAEYMLRKHLRWREEMNVTLVLKEYKPSEVMKKLYGNMFIGYDYDNAPVYYIDIGGLDIHGLVLSLKSNDMAKMHICFIHDMLQVLEQQSKKFNKRISKFSYIYDLKGLTFASAMNRKGIEETNNINKRLQDNYPERLKCVYIINATKLFTIPFAIIKSFLALSILEKIKVFGEDGWKEELLKQVPAEQLPAFLGGKRTDPDGNPLCLETVNRGFKVDKKFYIHRSVRSLARILGVKCITVPSSSISDISLEVEDDNSLIEWEFETNRGDIDFGILMKDGDNTTELLPMKKIDTSEYSETGRYMCRIPGTYVLRFSNSFSWITSKDVYYRIRVLNTRDLENRKEKKNVLRNT